MEMATPRLVSASARDATISRTFLAPATIVPDSGNRTIIDDDDFESLCDSIRVSGVVMA